MSKKTYFEPNVTTKNAVFAQGCFWGADGIYAVHPGVIRMRVGYTGGSSEHPTYKSIGDHTEAFLIEYDPESTNYANLLSVFWGSHDPTVPNKPQYKSAIYYQDEKEKQLAEDTLKQVQKNYQRKIVTEVLPASTFYDAEDYHQKYVLRSHRSIFHNLGLDGPDLLKSHVATRLNGYMSGHGSLEQFEKESVKWGLDADTLQSIRNVVQKGVKIMCH